MLPLPPPTELTPLSTSTLAPFSASKKGNEVFRNLVGDTGRRGGDLDDAGGEEVGRDKEVGGLTGERDGTGGMGKGLSLTVDPNFLPRVGGGCVVGCGAG